VPKCMSVIFFSFLKNYFWHKHIKTIQNIQIILNFSKKKNLNFLKTQPQPRSQTFPPPPLRFTFANHHHLSPPSLTSNGDALKFCCYTDWYAPRFDSQSFPAQHEIDAAICISIGLSPYQTVGRRLMHGREKSNLMLKILGCLTVLPSIFSFYTNGDRIFH
jgi:hypothetical protein